MTRAGEKGVCSAVWYSLKSPSWSFDHGVTTLHSAGHLVSSINTYCIYKVISYSTLAKSKDFFGV